MAHRRLERMRRARCETREPSLRRIGDGNANSLPFIPASSVRPGMVMVDETGQFDVVDGGRAGRHRLRSTTSTSSRPTTSWPNGIVTHNSIYKFRGADYRNLMRFEEEFPDATIIVLDQNYRSTQHILDAANAVIANNAARTAQAPVDRAGRWRAAHPVPGRGRARRGQRSWCTRSSGSPTPRACASATSRSSTGPTRRAACIEEALVRAGVPYRVVGGVKFYDRREVKDALAYLRALVNPDDEVSWKRIVNVPKRGVGDTSLAKVEAYAQRHETAVPRGAARRARRRASRARRSAASATCSS